MPLMPVPDVYAADRDATIALLNNTDWNDNVLTKVRSEFVCDLIRAMEAKESFVSNRAIEAAIQASFQNVFSDLSKKQIECIKWLAYFGRRYVDHDDLIAQGYVPFTQELIHQAFIEDKNIEFPGGQVAVVKRIKDKSIRAMVKGKRASFYNTGDTYPARLIAK